MLIAEPGDHVAMYGETIPKVHIVALVKLFPGGRVVQMRCMKQRYAGLLTEPTDDMGRCDVCFGERD